MTQFWDNIELSVVNSIILINLEYNNHRKRLKFIPTYEDVNSANYYECEKMGSKWYKEKFKFRN